MILAERFPHYMRLMRLDKPIGTLLLLWPTLWALWTASDGTPPLYILVIFAVGTLLMRSAGCVINDFADRNFDGHVKRTCNRPFPAGKVTAAEAWWLAAALALVSFILILPLNRAVLWLSLPALFLAISYPFTKRFFAIPQAYLGVAFGFGIPMGFAAILGTVPLEGWAMLLANVFWSVAYDTEYAMVDRDDDLKLGIKTSAITFGRFDVLIIMLCYAAMLCILAGIGVALDRGTFYFAGLICAGGVAVYHYELIKDRERMPCFKAFMHNNWLGAVIFAGILLDSLYSF